MNGNEQCKGGGGDDATITMKRAFAFMQTELFGLVDDALDSAQIRELISLGGQENPAMLLREMVKYPVLYKSSHYMAVMQDLIEAYSKTYMKVEESEKSPLTCSMDRHEKNISYYNEWALSGVIVLTELLMPLEESQETRSRSLRMLVKYFEEDCDRPSMHSADEKDAGGLRLRECPSWKEKYIEDVKTFLSLGADPTWLPEGSESSALEFFLKNLLRKVVSDDMAVPKLRELIPVFLTSKTLDKLKGSQRYSTLHSLFDVDYPILNEVIKEKIRTGASLLAIVNAYKEAIALVVKFAPGITESQDQNGLTVLHKLSHVLFKHPDFAFHYLAILPIIITRTNVNTMDSQSVTPYSFIKFIPGRNYFPPGLKTVISEIDNIFLQNEAEGDLTVKSIPAIQGFIILQQLNLAVWERKVIITILELLRLNGRSILKKNNMILIQLVNHAKYFLDTEFMDPYIHAIQIVVNWCKIKPGLQKSPINDLFDRIDNAWHKEDGTIFVSNHCVYLVNVQQANFLNFIEILIDVAEFSRPAPISECLECLLINAEFWPSTYYNNNRGWLHWTEKFIRILSMLVSSGADAFWTPDGTESPVPRITQTFFKGVIHILVHHKDLQSSLLGFIQAILKNKAMNDEEHQGTILHAFVAGAWEHLPEDKPPGFLRTFEKVLATILERCGRAVLDKTDQTDRNVLQCFLDELKTQKEIPKDACDIVQLLITEKSTVHQDVSGQTALHYLVGMLPLRLNAAASQNASVGVPETFLYILEMIVSSQNINLQDDQGETALHVLARIVFIYPELAHAFTAVFSSLVNEDNVNILDRKRLTPYSWIISARSTSSGKKKGLASVETIFRLKNVDEAKGRQGTSFILSQSGEMKNVKSPPVLTVQSVNFSSDYKEFSVNFSPIKQFSTNHNLIVVSIPVEDLVAQVNKKLNDTFVHRDEDPSKKTLLNKLEDLLSDLKNPEDLDNCGETILDIFSNDGPRIVRKKPSVIEMVVKKSCELITSKYYMRIVQVMASCCKLTLPTGKMFLDDARDEEKLWLLVRYPARALWLLRILTSRGLMSKTECLQIIVDKSEHISNKQDSFLFTEELVATIKDLLEAGADANEPQDKYQSLSPSAGNAFFGNIIHIIQRDGHLIPLLMDIIPYFFLPGNTKKNETRPLHSLLGFDWINLKKDLSEEHFSQYKQVVGKVIASDTSALEASDANGSYPLHIFLDGIGKAKEFLTLSQVSSIVALLRTESSIDQQDKDGNTALHLVSMLFPLGQKEGGQETLTDLLKQVWSVRNCEMQNKTGHTALSFLAKWVFLCTNQAGFHVSSAFDLISTETNINIPDINYITAYSWVLLGRMAADGIGRNTKVIFSTIEEILIKKGADLEVAQKGLGSTLLLWLEAGLSSEDKKFEKLTTLLNHINHQELPSFSNEHVIFEGILQHNHVPVVLSKNPKLWQITSDTIKGVTSQSNKSVCSCLSSALLESHCYYTTLGMDLLDLAIQKSGVLMETNIKSLQSLQGSVRVLGKHQEAYLKVLLSACNEEETAQRLSKENNWLELLLDSYTVPANLRKFGGKLAHILYGTIERCLEMKQLVNCLLFASYQPGIPDDQLFEQVFEIPMPENSFERGPLHLAVSLLHDQGTLGWLPTSLISEQIEARDLHGCTPLHIAHLHQNQQAIKVLINHGADTKAVDHFGLTPAELESRLDPNGPSKSFHMESCMDAKHHQLCSAVMTTESGILDKLKPLLVISPLEAQALAEEMELLIQRLLEGTPFEQTEIVTGGSIREKLKAGRLDEIDIQLLLKNAASSSAIEHCGELVTHSDFFENFMNALCTNLHIISWHGINLRLISSSKQNPWKFLREGHGFYSGVAVFVDIVPIFCQPDIEEPEIYEHRLAEIVEGAPPHSRRWILKWKMFHHSSPLEKTTFVLEWDILDSLPTFCRLGVVVAKALVHAYDCSHFEFKQVEMPVTSYMLKTSLFFLLKGTSDIRRISEALQYAAETTDELSNAAGMSGKLKFMPNPTWATEDDFREHAEDARIVATRIFKFIHFLAQKGCKVVSFWQEPGVSVPHRQAQMGEVDYISEICQCLLDCLEKSRFFQTMQ